MILIENFTEHNMKHSNAVGYPTDDELREEGSDGHDPPVPSCVPRHHGIRNVDGDHLGTAKIQKKLS